MSITPRSHTVCASTQLDVLEVRRRSAGNWFLTCLIFMGLASSALLNMLLVTTVEASTNQVKVLEFPLSTGTIPKTLKFPLYEQESIQYFSAGLGKEERSLSYPPFPLKLIFVQGERAYLAGVSVLVVNEDGTRRINIPGKEVEGPWLFIDAPTGTYKVSVTDSNGLTIEKAITIKTDKSTVVHFRFP